MSALSYLFCPAPPLAAVAPEPSPLFSPGRPQNSSLSRRQRLAEARRAPKRRPLKRQVCSCMSGTSFLAPVLYTMILRPKRWILCDRAVPHHIATFLYAAGGNFQEIYKTIIVKRRRQLNYFSQYNCYTATEPAIPLLKIYMDCAIQNQRLRDAFQVIARRWIRSKLTAKNTEDLLTGELPVKSVSLIDWPTRSIYAFEARTIARDMISRLTMSTAYFFPSPKQPRNPYTNELLTEGQFYSLVRQLRSTGETHWALEALYSAKYSLDEFERDMYMKLKRTIHNSVFANPFSDPAKEILLEFIEDQHDEHAMVFEVDIYRWAIENCMMHFKIHEWRIQCTRFYALRHFPPEQPEKDAERERIKAATKRLCAHPLLLVEKYNAVHEKKYVNVADRVVVPPPTIHIQYVAHQVISAADMAAILAVYLADEAEDEAEADAESENTDESPSEAD